MAEERYILLYHESACVHAADATPLLHAGEFPLALRSGGLEYRRLDAEDTFIFWDELRDSSNRTTGYTFLFPESPAFAKARLWNGSKNVVLKGDEL